MNINKRTITILLLVAIVSVIVILYTVRQANQPITTIYIRGSYVVNPKNTRALVGWASHVFVAKAKRLEGSIDDPSRREQTFFSAEVIDRIKGDLAQEITLSQFALLQNAVLSIAECEQFLQPDETYLFVTRYDETTNTYSIFSGGYGNIQITNEEQKSKLIAQFLEAYHNELPFDANNPEHVGSDQYAPIYPEPYPFEIVCHDDAGSYTPPTPLAPEPTTPPMQFNPSLPTPDTDIYPAP